MTRADKGRIEDRDALTQQWQETSARLGFDPATVTARANARSTQDLGNVIGVRPTIRAIVRNVQALATSLAERLGLREGDPLIPARLTNRSVEQVAAIHAVASAVRHLGEREAAFTRAEIYLAALGFALPTSLADIEQRVDQLLRQGHLEKGRGPTGNC
jgi:hypothetical protein